MSKTLFVPIKKANYFCTHIKYINVYMCARTPLRAKFFNWKLKQIYFDC